MHTHLSSFSSLFLRPTLPKIISYNLFKAPKVKFLFFLTPKFHAQPQNLTFFMVTNPFLFLFPFQCPKPTDNNSFLFFLFFYFLLFLFVFYLLFILCSRFKTYFVWTYSMNIQNFLSLLINQPMFLNF